MLAKKVTALLVSAALALSLLAGCGGSKALSGVFVDLLEGQYQNLSVQTDSKLEAALKKAVKAGGTEEEVYAALVENLGLAGKTISFSYSGFNGAGVGEQAVALTFLPGEDETAAARSALNGWSSVLGSLPKDGQYTASLTMVQAEGGYYAAVRLTVTRAGRDDDNDDDNKQPAVPQEIKVTTYPQTAYQAGQSFNPVGMVFNLVYSDGTSEEVTVTDGMEGLDWEPKILSADTKEVVVTYTKNGHSAQATISVTVTEVPLSKIEVTQSPNQTTYYEGDSFDPAGMELTLTYEDNLTKTLEGITSENPQGVSWDPVNLTVDTRTVTIKYGGKETTVNVTVNAVELTRIEVTTQPTKTTYYEGEKFDTTDMVVTAHYNNNTSKAVTGYTCTPETLTEGTTEVTIKYGEKETTVNVTVSAVELTSIEVTKDPNKTAYYAGDTFESDGMVVTAHYNNGTSKDVTNQITYTSDALNVGTTQVTVSYTEDDKTFSAPVNVTVKAVVLDRIEVTHTPYKIAYKANEQFDPDGMVVTAYYNNGTSHAVTDYTCTPETLTEDTTQVTVSYTEGIVTKNAYVEITIYTADYTVDEETNTYLVYTAEGLKEWAKHTGSNCTLMANIIWPNDETWTPVSGYSRTFNGDGHTIYNLNINVSSGTAAGFVTGLYSSGVVKNLTLENVNLRFTTNDNTKSYYIGAITSTNYGTIENCHVLGGIITVTGSVRLNASFFGGITGTNRGTIQDCSVSCDITVSALSFNNVLSLGGIAGSSYSTISHCTVSGNTLTGSATSAGNTSMAIGGVSGSHGQIDSCTIENVTIEADNSQSSNSNQIGGIVGSANSSTTLSDCTVSNLDITSTLNSSKHYVGGLVGYDSSNLVTDGNTYSGTATVQGQSVELKAKGYPSE